MTPMTAHGIFSTQPPAATLTSFLSSNKPGALASGSSHLRLSLTGMLFSQVLMRVALCHPLCPYPSVTISVMPSPDATPNSTNRPSTSPCGMYSPLHSPGLLLRLHLTGPLFLYLIHRLPPPLKCKLP